MLCVPALGWRQLRLLLLPRRVVAATAAGASVAPTAACGSATYYGWWPLRPLLRLVIGALLLVADEVAAPDVAASGGCDSGSCYVTAAAASTAFLDSRIYNIKVGSISLAESLLRRSLF